MRISDWSSDVCSSDLTVVAAATCRDRHCRKRHQPAADTPHPARFHPVLPFPDSILPASRRDFLTAGAARWRSDHVQIDIVVHGHALQPHLIERNIDNRLLLFVVEAARKIGAELGHPKRYALDKPAKMPGQQPKNE